MSSIYFLPHRFFAAAFAIFLRCSGVKAEKPLETLALPPLAPIVAAVQALGMSATYQITNIYPHIT